MKKRPAKPSNQGVRSDRYSGSKASNRVWFDPAVSAIEAAYDKYYSALMDSKEYPVFFTEEVQAPFIMPVTEQGLREELAKVPREFTEGLKGIFLLKGNKKMMKTFFRLFCYGIYWVDCIFLFPYPRAHCRYHVQKPYKPSILNEYRRVGAVITKADKEGIIIDLSGERLRNFYLRDVFIHELGHHVDRFNDKNYDKKEGFAEWFATEYGFRRKEKRGDL